MDFSALILAHLTYLIGRNSLADEEPVWALGWFLLSAVWALAFLFGELL